MATERVTLLDIEPDTLHISARDPDLCDHCVAGAGCGQRLLQGVTGNRSLSLALPGSLKPVKDCRLGDILELHLDDNQIARASLLLYGLPVTVMVLFTALTVALGATEAGTMAFALIALTATLAGIHHNDDKRMHGFLSRLRVAGAGGMNSTCSERDQ